ncbi:TPM domain-containing protein [Corynebacterium massiliense]|uniref:TPM domain-containing protein n=1 Tax=Corynebacterium massiliense TaxID=441501 RepID=UPI002352B234|nr:TPM domain-containing protein [Corynebacterium massiliense]
MTSTHRAPARLGRAALAALFAASPLLLAGAAPAGAATASPAYAAATHERFVAQGQGSGSVPTPSSITDHVVDEAGVLNAEEREGLEHKIRQLQEDSGRVLYVVYVNSLGGKDEKKYAEDIVEARGRNTAAVVIATQDRLMGTAAGTEWPQTAGQKLFNVASAPSADKNWAGAGSAAADYARGVSSGNGGGSQGTDAGNGDSGGAGWLIGGGAAALAAGGGIWAFNRRKTKQDRQETLTNAREIEPGDTDSLNQLPTDTLEELAQEELVSTDESIRRGKEELDIATSEFGPERTRQFTKAMNHSTSTLQRAFRLRQQLEQTPPANELERRQLLVDIISSCGQADAALDEEAANFADMRNLLINAESKLDELTQKTVDLRARLPHAQETLQALHSEYSAETLESVNDNPDLAEASLTEAEKLVEKGNELQSQPAGKQGALVGIIRDAEHATEVADRLLGGVENARDNIAAARSGLDDLIAEVEDELSEATALRDKGQSQGTRADWDSLERAVANARESVEAAKSHGAADPLGAYTDLANADTELDKQLDAARDVTASHDRQLKVYRNQVSTAASHIQAAEDLISSRGRLVGSRARTALADAQRLHAQALRAENSNLRQATDLAKQATNAARAAIRHANDDVNQYRRMQQARGYSSGAGNMLTGMLIGQALGGGFRGGGFGGGFGGGGGGGFSGSSRGGAF